MIIEPSKKKKKKDKKAKKKDKKATKEAKEKVLRHVVEQKIGRKLGPNENPFLPPIPQLALTDQTNPFVTALENIYSAAVSSSLAASIVELKILHQLSQDEEGEGEEVEDRFNKEQFLQLQQKFLELRTIKELGPIFGLDSVIVNQVLATRVQTLFGGGSGPVSGKTATAFLGSDEQFLGHKIKQKIKGEG